MEGFARTLTQWMPGLLGIILVLVIVLLFIQLNRWLSSCRLVYLSLIMYSAPLFVSLIVLFIDTAALFDGLLNRHHILLFSGLLIGGCGILAAHRERRHNVGIKRQLDQSKCRYSRLESFNLVLQAREFELEEKVKLQERQLYLKNKIIVSKDQSFAKFMCGLLLDKLQLDTHCRISLYAVSEQLFIFLARASHNPVLESIKHDPGHRLITVNAANNSIIRQTFEQGTVCLLRQIPQWKENGANKHYYRSQRRLGQNRKSIDQWSMKPCQYIAMCISQSRKPLGIVIIESDRKAVLTKAHLVQLEQFIESSKDAFLHLLQSLSSEILWEIPTEKRQEMHKILNNMLQSTQERMQSLHYLSGAGQSKQTKPDAVD